MIQNNDNQPQAAMALPSAIIRRAEELGYELPDLASRMGVSPLETVWLMAADNLTAPVLAKFAEVLETTPTALVEDAEVQLRAVTSTASSRRAATSAPERLVSRV